MRITDEILTAYVDGDADAQTRAAVEAAMAGDSAIRERVEARQRMRGAMAGAVGVARGESPAPRPSRPAEIVNLAAVRALKAAPKTEPPKRRAWVQWAALAACVVIGVIGARGLGSVGAPAVIDDRRGALMAEGALSRALDQQIAGAPKGASAGDRAIRIGVSFRSADKLYCRTFEVAREDGLTGVACRTPSGWRVRATAASSQREARPRGGVADAPAAISATVAALIDGALLDPQAEADAKAKSWRD